MKRVIVVGAGATLAEALPSKPKRALVPPLDASFFELCRVANLAGTKAVADYTRERFGFDPLRGGYGMEEVFNLIYSDAMAVPPPDGCLEAYSGLIKVYARAIGSTTKPLKGTSQAGVGALLRASLQRVPDDDLVFVTFNQDLVIENAIEATAATSKYRGIPWSLESSYRIPFVDCSRIRGYTAFRTKHAAPSIPVLKPHGSLNWLYHVRSATDPQNALRALNSPLHCLNSQDVLEGLKYRSSGKRVHVTPLIVPPIFEKASRYSTVLGDVWAEAAAAIETCDSLIFFGYSLPAADAWARTMFKASINQNRKLAAITVVDPSSDSAMRLREIAATGALHHYVDAKSFIASGAGT